MTREVRLRAEAERDLADAAGWYEQQRVGLGDEFLNEVLALFSAIAEAPFIYPAIHRSTRRAVVHRFPFGVYYRIDDNTIVVVAVIHGSRNPHRWKNRS